MLRVAELIGDYLSHDKLFARQHPPPWNGEKSSEDDVWMPIWRRTNKTRTRTQLSHPMEYSCQFTIACAVHTPVFSRERCNKRPKPTWIRSMESVSWATGYVGIGFVSRRCLRTVGLVLRRAVQLLCVFSRAVFTYGGSISVSVAEN